MTQHRTNNSRGGGTTASKNIKTHDYTKTPPTILKNQNRVNSSNNSYSNNNSNYRSNTTYSSQPVYRHHEDDYDDEDDDDYQDDESSYGKENYEENDSRSTTSEDSTKASSSRKYSNNSSSSLIPRPSQFQSQHVSSSYGSSNNNGGSYNQSSSQVSSPRSTHSSYSSNSSRNSSSTNNPRILSKTSSNTTSGGRYHSTHYSSSNNLMNVSNHSETLSNIKNGLDPITQAFLSRKPLLHIIVLFAADVRVRNYAQQIQDTFLNRGINVYTQLGCYTKEVPSSPDDHEFIKPDHLQEVITNSIADYVAVVGDRNMKHRTCQAKKNGKLVEVSIDDRVEEIIQDWDKSSHNHASEFPILDSICKMASVNELSPDQIYELIEAFAGVRHIKERIDRLKKSISELKEWKTPRSQKSIQTITDEKMLSKLTTSNNAAIRLHKDLISASEFMQNLPATNMTGITLLDPDDEKGASLNSKHLHTTSESQTPDDESIISISATLKQLLIDKCIELIPTVEKLGDQMSEIIGTSSLWAAYIKEHNEEQRLKQTKKAQQAKSTAPTTPASTSSNYSTGRKRTNSTSSTSSTNSFSSTGSTGSANKWSCSECTYLNVNSLSRCKLCDTPRPSEQEWIDASKKGNASSNATKNSVANNTKPTPTTTKVQPTTTASNTKKSTANLTVNTSTNKTTTNSSTTPTSQPIPNKVIIPSPNTNVPLTSATPSPLLNPQQTTPTIAWQTPLASSSLLGALANQPPIVQQQQPQQPPPNTTNPQQFTTSNFGAQQPGGLLVRGGNIIGNIQYPSNMVVGLMPGNAFIGGMNIPNPVGGGQVLGIPNNAPSRQYEQEYPSLDQLSKGSKKSQSGSNSTTPTLNPLDMINNGLNMSNTPRASPIVSSPRVKDRSNFGFPSSPISNQSNEMSQFSQMQLFDNSNSLNNAPRGFSWDIMTGSSAFGLANQHNFSQSVSTTPSPSYSLNHHQEVANSVTDSLLSEKSPSPPLPKTSSNLINAYNNSNSTSSAFLSYFDNKSGSTWGSESSSSTWNQPPANVNDNTSFSSPSKGFVSSGGLGFGANSPFMSNNTSNSNSFPSFSSGKSAFSPFGNSEKQEETKTTTPTKTPTTPATPTKSSRRVPVNQPCVVCGQESMYECNFCASLRRKGVHVAPTYFCSSEHQMLAWKEHQKVHQSASDQESPYGVKYY
ncbi:predicted protein [Naegleria gruberi]|uniref:Predicted protein n=1 Tax=Naegleria gruberi TaxID=5762 RepID=D2VR21_NAEGR|nr:uncharacterized protein NAEGRDRAFT_51577 [Naegleria gruberi]EFC40815.1 predicted protein [Naegleria gruberi]|eukprot:XP_002673559.1 predicted protein [Naegleria gruberi strain NEG-M]